MEGGAKWGLIAQDRTVPSEPLPPLVGHSPLSLGGPATGHEGREAPPEGLLLALVPVGKQAASGRDATVSMLVARLLGRLPAGKHPRDGFATQGAALSRCWLWGLRSEPPLSREGFVILRPLQGRGPQAEAEASQEGFQTVTGPGGRGLGASRPHGTPLARL